MTIKPRSKDKYKALHKTMLVDKIEIEDLANLVTLFHWGKEYHLVKGQHLHLL